MPAVAVPAAPVQDDARGYLIRLRRSVIGNQPYDSYAPRMQFLQLGEVQAHRSVINMARKVGNNKQEWIHATTSLELMVDDAEQAIVPELMTESEDDMKVWGYLMTQYNLKPGLWKFGERGATAVVEELTQLHIMDTWTGMDPSKLLCKDRVKALSSLMFLKEK